MHIKLTNGIPEKYTIGQLRRDNPQVSFPKNPTDELLASYNVFPLTPADQPAYDQATHRIEEGTPVLVDGAWTQAWDVIALTAEEISEKDAESKANNASQAKALLLETDWCENASVRNTAVTPHLTNSADFDTYRLALRAIVIDPPVTVTTWPVKPQGIWA
jgi:hypothetical protein